MVESIITIFVVAIAITIFGTLLNVRNINRGTAYRSKAAALADEELNALRRLDFSQLTDQTNCTVAQDCPFKNMLYNAGTWGVIADDTDTANHSGPNVLELAGASGFSNSQSGQFLFPAGVYGDVTLTAKWKVMPDSVSDSNPNTGWLVGFLLRSRDSKNGYRLRVGENSGSVHTDFDALSVGYQNIYLEKLENGTATKVAEGTATVSKGTWFALSLAATGPNFSITIDANPAMTGTDSTWTTGPAALIGWNGVHAEVDDIQTVTGTTSSWNFTDSTMPVPWIRLSLNDLPDSTPTTFDDNGTAFIEPYPVGSTTMKRVTVTVSWVQNGSPQSYSTTSFIGMSGLGV